MTSLPDAMGLICQVARAVWPLDRAPTVHRGDTTANRPFREPSVAVMEDMTLYSGVLEVTLMATVTVSVWPSPSTAGTEVCGSSSRRSRYML